MGTEFRNEQDEVMGNRWFGGTDRGVQVQAEFTEQQWNSMDQEQSVTGDDGSRWDTMREWMAEMQATSTFTWMNRFTMNRRARDWEQTADRWFRAGHVEVAHGAVCAAQDARNWRG